MSRYYELKRKHLLLDRTGWAVLIAVKGERLSPWAKQWLAEWDRWEEGAGEMSEEQRSYVRYGHYLGWNSAR